MAAVRRCSPNSSALRAGACLDEDGGNNVGDGVVHNDHRGQGKVLVPFAPVLESYHSAILNGGQFLI